MVHHINAIEEIFKFFYFVRFTLTVLVLGVLVNAHLVLLSDLSKHCFVALQSTAVKPSNWLFYRISHHSAPVELLLPLTRASAVLLSPITLADSRAFLFFTSSIITVLHQLFFGLPVFLFNSCGPSLLQLCAAFHWFILNMWLRMDQFSAYRSCNGKMTSE